MYSCTFIGHRDCDEGIKEKLYATIEKLITEHNVTTFYVGTHGNFDFYAYRALCELEKIYKIKISVVLSHLSNFPDYCDSSKTVFPEELETTPYKYAIIKRNNYMLRNSQFMICYVNSTFSNTYNFVKTAVNKKLQLINLGAFNLNKIQY